MASVTLEKLTKTYAGGQLKAVNDLSLDIKDGEFLVLVGPSGCGKSTALRMIAGLEEITDGAVWIGDEFVNDTHPKDRDIAMVFQNYALYPHMSVFDNIAFPLQIAKRPKAEIRQRVVEASRILELESYLARRPGQLSGGQRQRVAMGRAIVRQPAVYLMDEPLSNLDAKLRVQMRAEIAQLQHRLGTTTIYVTHDQIEAMTMGHRVALLKNGILQQVDTPADIYSRPRNMFVASFIGSPTMNLYYGTLGAVTTNGATLELGSSKLELPAGVFVKHPALAGYAGRRVVVGIRPEDLYDPANRPDLSPQGRLKSTAALVEALGSDVLVHFGLDAEPAIVQSSDSLQEIKTGDKRARAIARLSSRSHVQIGMPIEVAVDVEHTQFFDPDTTEAIWA
ncbi:MAG: sn-glycerol-3-phosphate ABC transporter ATP-binding protein UgpC [Devosia sp.]